MGMRSSWYNVMVNFLLFYWGRDFRSWRISLDTTVPSGRAKCSCLKPCLSLSTTFVDQFAVGNKNSNSGTLSFHFWQQGAPFWNGLAVRVSPLEEGLCWLALSMAEWPLLNNITRPVGFEAGYGVLRGSALFSPHQICQVNLEKTFPYAPGWFYYEKWSLALKMVMDGLWERSDLLIFSIETKINGQQENRCLCA